jgi:peptide deformylase
VRGLQEGHGEEEEILKPFPMSLRGSVMEIITAPNTFLKRVCRPGVVLSITQLEALFLTMVANNGAGLAAPQVGIDARVFVTNWAEIFICPKIVSYGAARVETKEGCLSIPGKQFRVQRSLRIRLACGRVYENEQAIVVQHECDHLDGILISDRGIEIQ